MSIKGYKVFNPDWTCRGFQFEVGKTYKHDGDIGLCKAGFHFCRKASACFNYYDFNKNNHVAEVEAIGKVETENDKSVTDEIVIIREIPWNEVLVIANEGTDCTGYGNTGDCNTGDWNTGNRNTGNKNTGNWNTGNWNTGNKNTGNWNTGNCNTGNWNTGNKNTGNRNTGNKNTGNWNTGDWNSTNFSSGFFNTVKYGIIAFNKELKISREEFLNCKGVKILNWKYENNWWIYTDNMTDEEKSAHPEYKYTGGYLKSVDFKTACNMMWNGMDEDERQAVRKIPNFDADVFKEITGIEV